MSNKIFDKLIAKEGLDVGVNHLKLFKNVNFSMYPARAFALIIQRLSKDKSVDYIKDLGKVMGDRAAKEMFDEIKKLNLFLDEDYKKLEGVILLSGFGNTSFLCKDKNCVIQCKDHPVISKAKDLFRKKSNVCEFYGSIFGSFIETFEKGKNLKLKHTKCICKGDKFCEWEYKSG